MSLTAHIRTSLAAKDPIGVFLREQFPEAHNIASGINQILRTAHTIRFVGPQASYPILGTAIDYRIRYYFGITPYRDLAAYIGAGGLKTAAGAGCILAPEYLPERKVYTKNAGYDAEAITNRFFEDLQATLAQIQPCGRRLGLEDERLLARYCYVLALFEDLYRRRWTTDEEMAVFGMPAPKRTTQEFLAIPTDVEVDDLCAMSWLFYDGYADMLSLPAILNPTFEGSKDVGGADADLIVDGCLIELKATIKTRIKVEWLWQLAGYVLLDYDDVLGIDSVGIYFLRQGLLRKWPVETFFELMAGDSRRSIPIPQLRQTFRSLTTKGRLKAKQEQTKEAAMRQKQNREAGLQEKYAQAERFVQELRDIYKQAEDTVLRPGIETFLNSNADQLAEYGLNIKLMPFSEVGRLKPGWKYYHLGDLVAVVEKPVIRD